VYQDQVKKLSKQIQNFDFEEAQETLAGLRESLGKDT
jgi:hypothetical protein